MVANETTIHHGVNLSKNYIVNSTKRGSCVTKSETINLET